MSLESLDTGVYAWLQSPSGAGRANAGVVIDADGITLVDSLMTPDQWAPLAEATSEMGTPVRRLVLTSSGIEHAGGTGAFPLAAIYGRQQTSLHLDQPPNVEAWRALYADEADAFEELVTRPVSHVVATDVQLTPAISLVTTTGQQAENLVVVVPGAAVCFAGAMACFATTPCCYQGDPGRWAAELDRIGELAPVIVPGHGPIGGVEELRELRDYLSACVAADGDPDDIPAGPWDLWADRLHDGVNVERAALLAEGRDEIPQSMLRLAGMS